MVGRIWPEGRSLPTHGLGPRPWVFVMFYFNFGTYCSFLVADSLKKKNMCSPILKLVFVNISGTSFALYFSKSKFEKHPKHKLVRNRCLISTKMLFGMFIQWTFLILDLISHPRLLQVLGILRWHPCYNPGDPDSISASIFKFKLG